MTGRRGLARTALASALLMVTATTTAAAAPGAAESRRERGSAWRDAGVALPLLIRAANLTPEQDGRVRSILATHRAVTRNTVEQLRRAQEELADRLLAPGPVQSTDLQPLLKQIATLREQLLQDSAQIALEVRGVLTPEQLAKAGQLRGRMRQIQSELQQRRDRP